MSTRFLLNIHLNKLLGKESADTFLLWAFGKNHEHLEPNIDMINIWNLLHGDLLTLDECGSKIKDMENMVEVWKNQVDNKI